MKPLAVLTIRLHGLTRLVTPSVLMSLQQALIAILGPSVWTVAVVDLIPGVLICVAARTTRCRRPSTLIILLLISLTRLMLVVVRHRVVGELRLFVLTTSMSEVSNCPRFPIFIFPKTRRCVHCLIRLLANVTPLLRPYSFLACHVVSLF